MIPSMSELPVHSPTLFLLNSFALSLLQHVDQSQHQQQQQQQQHVGQVNLDQIAEKSKSGWMHVSH